MKKFIVFAAVFFIFTMAARAEFKYEAGIGSGYVFYGDEDLKDLLDDFNQTGQIILCGNAGASFSIASVVAFTAGVDSILDARWAGSSHIALWDYCGYAGFDIYPGIAGLYGSVDYCLGRRVDYINLRNAEDEVVSTDWGNGFNFGIGYNFGHGKSGWAPKINAAWRHMPRGGNDSDDILTIKLCLGW